jgi:hypothetical protein
LGDIHPSASTGRASPSIGAKRRPPTPSRNNSHSHSHNANSGGTPPPQRPITPSSASAAGSESPTPSQAKPALSIQTQLASMRGALEASRLREEKNKVEMEKYVKEIETMKWENANWRRAEIEVSKQSMVAGFYHSLASDSVSRKSPIVDLRSSQSTERSKEFDILCFFFWASVLLLFGSMLTPLFNFTCY